MKVKIFSFGQGDNLESALNAFLPTVKVIEIKFATTTETYDVMVIYEETKND